MPLICTVRAVQYSRSVLVGAYLTTVLYGVLYISILICAYYVRVGTCWRSLYNVYQKKMIKIAQGIDLENYTLILPSVAVGNLGQLCVDLIISNLNLNKIGSMWSPMFLPICGLDPYYDDDNDDSNILCTAADFYIGTSLNIIVLQLRSPYVGISNDFFEELSAFVRQNKISKTVILTSSYDHERVDRSESGLRYLATDASLMGDEKLVKNLCWIKHGERNNSWTKSETTSTMLQRLHIPGGGFANGLYDHFASAKIPCTVVFCYCSEGNNVPDALILFKGLNRWLNLTKDPNIVDLNNIKYPPSWKDVIFDKPLFVEMY